MILESKKEIEPAIRAYRTAQKDDILSPALPRLIEIYIKNKRYEELARLRREFDEEVASRQQPGLSAEFDRVATSVSMKLGEKDRADYFASRVIDNRRNDVAARRAYAWLLDKNNEAQQAEESFQELVKEKPNDASGWLSLILFQAQRKTAGRRGPDDRPGAAGVQRGAAGPVPRPVLLARQGHPQGEGGVPEGRGPAARGRGHAPRPGGILRQDRTGGSGRTGSQEGPEDRPQGVLGGPDAGPEALRPARPGGLAGSLGPGRPPARRPRARPWRIDRSGPPSWPGTPRAVAGKRRSRPSSAWPTTCRSPTLWPSIPGSGSPRP